MVTQCMLKSSATKVHIHVQKLYIGIMLPKYETFLIQSKCIQQLVAGNISTYIGQHVAGKMFPATCCPKCCLVYGGLKGYTLDPLLQTHAYI